MLDWTNDLFTDGTDMHVVNSVSDIMPVAQEIQAKISELHEASKLRRRRGEDEDERALLDFFKVIAPAPPPESPAPSSKDQKDTSSPPAAPLAPSKTP